MHRFEFEAMGSRILAVVDGLDRRAEARLAEVPGWFETWEDCLSRFRPESELSRLNRSAGKDVSVSGVLWDVLAVAFEAAQSTGGLVQPTILEALQTAGYDRTWESMGSRVAEGAARVAPPVQDWRLVERNPHTRSVRLPAGTSLDLGGFGKGWAADKAARRLGTAGPALVDAGGDIAVSGPREDGQPWPIGVADPGKDGETIALLSIRSGGVATSGRDYKRWRQGEVWRHHLIDPRTGQPAETDILATTVVAPSARAAEAAAKAVLILGSRDGLRWLEAHQRLAGLAALESGRVVFSRRMTSYLWSGS
ncbi:MAG TPA: FAD:protein FMN transferase [Anaerolineales bacterium]|nr:FAD:protein FMN transferase [Anaerolineales bacterium]